MSEIATRICARLLREGTVLRSELPELDLPDVRGEVEESLATVGMELASSAYSDHVGVRISAEATSGPGFETSSNMHLRSDACALLVILWARLVLQKRTASDAHSIPGQAHLFDRDAAQAARDFTPSVRVETLLREFSHILGSRTNLRRLIGRLRTLGFAAGRGEVIEAGPLLELGIDGERMIAFIRRGVLAKLLEEREADGGESPPEPDPAAQVIEALNSLGNPASSKEIGRESGIPLRRLRPLLKELADSGRILRTGNRASTRYEIMKEE